MKRKIQSTVDKTLQIKRQVSNDCEDVFGTTSDVVPNSTSEAGSKDNADGVQKNVSRSMTSVNEGTRDIISTASSGTESVTSDDSSLNASEAIPNSIFKVAPEDTFEIVTCVLETTNLDVRDITSEIISALVPENISEDADEDVSNVLSEIISKLVSEDTVELESEDTSENRTSEVIAEEVPEVSQNNAEVSSEDIVCDDSNFLPYSIPKYFYKLVGSLTEDQRKFAVHILGCMIVKQPVDEVPFHYFLSGPPGSGKSFVVNAIVKLVNGFFTDVSGTTEKNNKNKTVIKAVSELSLVLNMAPTEETATIIDGSTLYEALVIPQMLKESAELPALSADVAEVLYSKLKSVKLIIIDEISSVGKFMISHVNTRLKQIFGVSSDFANLPVILVGDLRLVPPKFDSPIYENTLLWRKFQYYELETNLRQKNDRKFSRVLTNFSKGELTDNDLEVLNQRNFEFAPDLICPCVKTLHVFSDEESVHWFNSSAINNLDAKSFVSFAEDSVLGEVSSEDAASLLEYLQHRPLQDVEGLPYRVTLKLSAKYMISHTVDSSAGHRKGVIGYVKEISQSQICLVVEDIDQDMVQKVFIKKISVILRNNFMHNLTVSRYQFPLVPAEGVHVENLRGKTVFCMCVPLLESKNMRGNLLYAALSRVPTLESLHLVGCVTKSHAIKDEQLLAELARLQDNSVNIPNSILCPSNDFKVSYQDLDYFTNSEVVSGYKAETPNELLSRYITSCLVPAHDIMIFKGFIPTREKVSIIKKCKKFGHNYRFEALKNNTTFLLLGKPPHFIVKKINRHISNNIINLVLIKINHLFLLSGYFGPRLSYSKARSFVEEILNIIPSKSPLIIIGGFHPKLHKMKAFERFHELKLVKTTKCSTRKAISVFTNLMQYRTQIHHSVLPFYSSPICVQVSRLLTQYEGDSESRFECNSNSIPIDD